MQTLELNGNWKVQEAPLDVIGTDGLQRVLADQSDWMKAKVPGEIHLDLMRAGRMDEPLTGLNAKKSRWPEERSWWYVKTFKTTASLLGHERQELIFDGLDLYAQVYLNGELLGETKNAFIPYIFDVRHRLVKGENTIAVRLTSGEDLVSESLRPAPEDRHKRQSFPGISHLRKPQFTYGWDWVDALPNIGLWRGVRIEARSGVVIHDSIIATRLNKKDARLDFTVVIENLHPWSDRATALSLVITYPRGRSIKRGANLLAQVGRSTVPFTVDIPDAQVWWPNGMGEQPLYHVTIESSVDKKTCDRREMNVGLRTIEIDRAAISAGCSRFCIKVNGHDVFCKGGNWIPADAIIARVSKKKYETLVSDAKNANLNMLRIWGGGVYEAPAFYDACDRAGILIWQDFMFSCAEYPDNDAKFRANVRAEAESVVRSLRHHPSVALWNGNNENVWGFADWWNNETKYGGKGLKTGGSITYNQILPDVCRTLDPTRPYWPSSPFGGARPNDENAGDCHWWGPCTMHADVNRRIAHEVFDECTARFVSEYGVIGPCHLDSVNEYLNPDERFVDSPAWKEHTNTFEKSTIPAAIQRHYAELENLSLAERTLYGQLFQATMYGRSIEALRFRKYDARHDCQGALIWMYNDCWGETGWTPIDYYLRRKPSYYWIRNACAPIKAIVRRRDNALATRIVNDTLQKWQGSIHFGWVRVDGTESRMKTKPVRVDANSMMEVGRIEIPPSRKMSPEDWIYTAYLSGGGTEANASTWLFVPHRQMVLAKPKIVVTTKGSMVTLTSDVYCHAVYHEDGGGRIFSDNYFDLLPGVSKQITCVGKMPKRLHFAGVL